MRFAALLGGGVIRLFHSSQSIGRKCARKIASIISVLIDPDIVSNLSVRRTPSQHTNVCPSITGNSVTARLLKCKKAFKRSLLCLAMSQPMHIRWDLVTKRIKNVTKRLLRTGSCGIFNRLTTLHWFLWTMLERNQNSLHCWMQKHVLSQFPSIQDLLQAYVIHVSKIDDLRQNHQ